MINTLNAIADEVRRQDELKRSGKFKWTCADDYDAINLTTSFISKVDAAKLAVLAEEFGEVSRLVVEALIHHSRRNTAKLRKELVQVAAVCVSWISALDEETRTSAFDGE